MPSFGFIPTTTRTRPWTNIRLHLQIPSVSAHFVLPARLQPSLRPCLELYSISYIEVTDDFFSAVRELMLPSSVATNPMMLLLELTHSTIITSEA